MYLLLTSEQLLLTRLEYFPNVLFQAKLEPSPVYGLIINII